MNGSQRFVADTNVLVSFILRPNSTPGHAVAKALDRSLIVFSDVTFAELSRVLRRPKFDPYPAPGGATLFDFGRSAKYEG